MLSGEATNTNLTVFGLTRSGLELTIYHNRDEHANHNPTNAVDWLGTNELWLRYNAQTETHICINLVHFWKLPSSGTFKITFIRYVQNYLHQVHSKLPSSGTFKIERLENQTIWKCLGAIQPKGLNMTTKINLFSFIFILPNGAVVAVIVW